VTNSICLYSEVIDKKANEIPVAQKDTISIIESGKGDYVGRLKGNQSGLFRSCK
jgi:hypothetical protein